MTRFFTNKQTENKKNTPFCVSFFFPKCGKFEYLKMFCIFGFFKKSFKLRGNDKAHENKNEECEIFCVLLFKKSPSKKNGIRRFLERFFFPKLEVFHRDFVVVNCVPNAWQIHTNQHSRDCNHTKRSCEIKELNSQFMVLLECVDESKKSSGFFFYFVFYFEKKNQFFLNWGNEKK